MIAPEFKYFSSRESNFNFEKLNMQMTHSFIYSKVFNKCDTRVVGIWKCLEKDTFFLGKIRIEFVTIVYNTHWTRDNIFQCKRSSIFPHKWSLKEKIIFFIKIFPNLIRKTGWTKSNSLIMTAIFFVVH